MSFEATLRSQFHNPHGLLGRVAGAIMARRPSNRERNEWAVSLLDIQPQDRVLEIGFGPGLAIAEIARRLTTGTAVGLDHSELMLLAASRRNAAAIAAGRVELRLGSAESLPAFEEPFDKLLAVNSFQFWRTPVEVLRALRWHIRRGGTIAIVHQPRMKGATDAIAHKRGAEITDQLERAGFRDCRFDVRRMKPVAVACALGRA